MPNLGVNINTLIVTIATPVNNSPNVTLSNINVVVNVSPTSGSDYSAYVETIMLRGLWSGNQFIPANRITLVTASE